MTAQNSITSVKNFACGMDYPLNKNNMLPQWLLIHVRNSCPPYTHLRSPLEVTPRKMRFASNPLNYDVILGREWTSKHHAIINCYTNEITFERKEKAHTIVAGRPKNHSLVSVNAIKKDHDQIYPLYAVVLRKIEETNQEISEKNRAQDVQRILQEYKDVFS